MQKEGSMMKKGFLRKRGAAVLCALCCLVSAGGCSEDVVQVDEAPEQISQIESTGVGDTYAMVVKEKTNPYMLKMFEGFQMACEELGVNALLMGPDSYTAEAQIELVEELIELDVAAIAIAANHTDALEPVLTRAMEAGIMVVSLDSSVNAQSRMVHIQQADPERIGRVLIQAAHKMTDGEGTAVIISSTPHATNQNLWVSWMKREVEENPEKYAGFVLLPELYGEDSMERTEELTLLLLQEHPDLDVIITPSVVSMLTVGNVLREQNSSVLFTGLGLPSEIADFINDGSCPWMYLWNPIDIGYLGAYAASALDLGEITGKEGDTFYAGSMGLRAVVSAADGGTEILLGDPIKFDQDNINEWKLVY